MYLWVFSDKKLHHAYTFYDDQNKWLAFIKKSYNI